MKAWSEKAMGLLRSSLTPPQTKLNELDWKQELTPDSKRLAEHISAYSNYPGGGILAFGIASNATPVGITGEEVTATISRIAYIARSSVEPAVQIDHECIDFESKRLLLVQILESPVKPVHIRQRGLEESFVRSGATTRAASRTEVATMLMTSRPPCWEELPASGILSDEEVLSKLKLSPIFKMLDRPEFSSRSEIIEWLANEHFIQQTPAGGSYITNLGAIAAAEHPAEFEAVSRRAVRVIQYKGLNKTSTLSERVGNLGYAIGFQGLISYIVRRLPRSEVISEALRVMQPVYPEVAIREVVANALIHQDFSIGGTSPMIEIFDDRIEITNPGPLLPSKQIDRLIGTQGESRNEKLAGAFRRYRICEERGSGLIKAAFECEIFGLPPVDFINGANYFKVALYAPRTFAQMTEKERLNACYQHAVLKHLSSSALTNKSLRERLKMPERHRSMVSVLIQEAIDNGLIKAAGPENKSMKFTEYLPYWA